MRQLRRVVPLLFLLLPLAANAVERWHPPAGSTDIPLWPEGRATPPPQARGPEELGSEVSRTSGERWAKLQNVSVPTMTMFAPTGVPNGTAVLVVPGGGYRVLAMDLEGSEICDWLSSRGVICVLLKYRVPGSGPNWNPDCNCRDIPKLPMALQDAQRAMGLLREQAARWRIDPGRIGVIGFSAGGHVVVGLSTHMQRSYPALDAADAQSSRPDFAMLMYPGHLWTGQALGLAKDIQVTAAVPPTFIVQAQDDATDNVRESLSYYQALLDAGVPTELHLFARGGHAFGLRLKDAPVSIWHVLAEHWMQDIGMLPAR